jgi:hypothetical protein
MCFWYLPHIILRSSCQNQDRNVFVNPSKNPHNQTPIGIATRHNPRPNPHAKSGAPGPGFCHTLVGSANRLRERWLHIYIDWNSTRASSALVAPHFARNLESYFKKE